MKLRKTKPPARTCADCGNGIKKAKRIANGEPYCDNCYPRLFVKSQCSKCAGPARAMRNDPTPICGPCSREGRTCLRCEKPVPRAGIRVGTRVACASCAPHFRIKEPCERCQAPSSQLTRIVGVTDQRLCPSCRAKELNVTCASCGKYRTRYAITAAREEVCKSCALAPGAVHGCPDCGASVGGLGDAPCLSCGFIRSLRRRESSLATLLRSDAGVALLSGFTTWCIEMNRTSNALAKFDSYAKAIARLDAAVPPGAALDQALIASLFTQEELRRSGLLAQYLGEVRLHPSPQALKDRMEDRKLAVLLAGIRGEFFERSVHEYAAHLDSSDRGLSRRTVRTYVEAAVRLWASAFARGSKAITQQEVDWFLRRQAGYRNSVSNYLGFLGASSPGDRLRVPAKVRPAESIRTARISVEQLLARLKTSDSQRMRGALTAELLAELFGVHLSTIVTLKRGDVREAANGLELKLGEWILLSGDVANWVREVWEHGGQLPSKSDWLFRGRVAASPLSVAAVGYHLKQAPRLPGTQPQG